MAASGTSRAPSASSSVAGSEASATLCAASSATLSEATSSLTSLARQDVGRTAEKRRPHVCARCLPRHASHRGARRGRLVTGCVSPPD
eukprot:scaffold328920_cov52-Tisochrysis_lutea.AAC.3